MFMSTDVRQQVNSISAWIDCSMVYGVTNNLLKNRLRDSDSCECVLI